MDSLPGLPHPGRYMLDCCYIEIERVTHMSKTTGKLVAPAISCNHCAMAITNGLKLVEDIDNVSVDVATKTVTVDYDTDAISEDAIKAKLSDLGYPAEE